jgi:hypothetical protein
VKLHVCNLFLTKIINNTSTKTEIQNQETGKKALNSARISMLALSISNLQAAYVK